MHVRTKVTVAVVVAAAFALEVISISCRWSGSSIGSAAGEPARGSPTTASSSRALSVSPDYLASHLLDEAVENEDGQVLGRLKDLAIDSEDGRVTYAVIASGGILALGKRLAVVPGPALSSATTKADTLALDVSKDRWLAAPSLKREELAAGLNSEHARAVDRYYRGRSASPSPEPGPNGAGGAPSPGAVAPAGRGSGGGGGAFSQERALRWARDLFRKKVVNRQGIRIGKVTDLLLDVSGRHSGYAIVSTPGLLEPSESFAIPFRLLHQAEAALEVDANPTMFESAAWFDTSKWLEERTSVSQIYRFPQ